jgi:dolichol-phosphate mannosyltransferase
MDVIHRPGKMGLGTAYITGFKYAMDHGAQALGQMDADFSHPVEKIPELVAAISQHDLVIGSRNVAGGSLDKSWPLWRKGLSAWGNFYARTILGLPMRDCTGGFRLYRQEVIRHLPLDRIRSNGYIFQVEMAYLVTKMGYSVDEIPIYFADPRWGKSKMNMRIQIEAALRVWQLPWAYRDIHPV